MALASRFTGRPYPARGAAAPRSSEETGLDGRALHLEQVRTYATPGRDPRGAVASVAYLAIAPDLPVPVAGTDAARARRGDATMLHPAMLRPGTGRR
ncbi:hypothetical protein ACH4OY_09500 [Micromonospora rubida]|uniref:Uncharacterized protein n=1 Tax=Micromonospora rubida TaxID=2697657 RepID=A0ABW7SGU7_9ACTN